MKDAKRLPEDITHGEDQKIMKELKITVLAENTSACALPCEHGLSLYLEYHENAYLLDAGSSDLFMRNAAALSADLSRVKLCILSHGHYDHSTGLEAFLETCPEVPVYAMRTYDGAYYSGAGGIRYIGVPESLKTVYRSRFRMIDAVTEIDGGIWAVPHSVSGLEEIGRRTRLYVKKGEDLAPDGFAHEMSTVFETADGLVICSSCSHAGLLPILAEVQSAFPDKPLYAFIGGLHMMGSRHGQETSLYTREELEQLTEDIAPFHLQHIYTGHCTGRAAYAMLKELLGEMLSPLSTGIRFTP